MKIDGVVWLRDVVDKLALKHHVDPYEVEQALGNSPQIRFVKKGYRKDEDVYMALGRSDAGRYLTVLFIRKKSKEVLILSARDMAKKERRQYDKRDPKKLPDHMPIRQLVEFFESHDMGEYWEGLPEAHFEIDIKKRRHLVAIDERIVPELNAIARSKKLPSERLINTWLREKIRTTKQAQKPR